MTPLEILSEVKLRFPVLLHDEEDKLKALLMKAMRRYQDYAGFKVKKRVQKKESIFKIPDDFLSLISVTDSTNAFVKADVWQDEGEIELKLRGGEVYPLIASYMRNITEKDLDSFEVPSAAAGLIADYLEILIDIPNSERRRTVAIAGKLDASGIPTEDVLQTRKTDLEDKISQNRAILPTFSIR